MKTLNRKKHRGSKGEFIFYLALIALPIIQVLIFYFYVNFNSIMMAFQSYDGFGDYVFDANPWANFSEIWANMPTIWVALKNSLVVWIFTAVLGTFLALVFSYYIYKGWILSKTFKFFLFLPSVLPSILLVLVFKFFVNEAIPGYTEALTGSVPEFTLLQNSFLPTVIFYNVWICFGTQLLINTGAMSQIPPEIIEAGKVDGVSTIREFFSIVLPMILPTISTFLIASVATIFTNQANIYAFIGDGAEVADYTIGYYLFILVESDLHGGPDQYTYASALGIVCTLIAFPLTLGVRRLLEGKGDE